MRSLRTILLALVLAAVAAPAADARHGSDDDRGEARVAASCSRGADGELKLKARDGGIEVELEVEHARRGELWRVTLVQEGRVVWRGRVRTSRSGGRFQIERRLRDQDGADRITARATGPRGVSCLATATLPDD